MGCYNFNMFLERLSQVARELCGLDRERPIVVGVSGGADSLALMDGLFRLNYPLIVAHLDHGLRPESGEDARYVQLMAEVRGLPYIMDHENVRKQASENGQSLEEAARSIRYNFLFNQARKHAAQAVAVAHHADDQVETVLMHFLRGAGLPGLSGMAYRSLLPVWDRDVPLVRPLLSHWRKEIEAYLAETGIEARVDVSNWDETFFRNRLRHSLIPALEMYNPQIRKSLWRMSDVLAAEEKFLSKLAEDAWNRCVSEDSSCQIVFKREDFLSLSLALQRRVLLRAVQTIRPARRDVGFDAIERGIEFIQNPAQKGEIDFVGRLNLAVVRDQFVVKTWRSTLPEWDSPLLVSPDDSRRLGPNDELSLDNGWCLISTLLPEIPSERPWLSESVSAKKVWLDAEGVSFPMVVRSRRPGDRWRPLGLTEGTQKLKDFFINEKLPAHLRDRWPLVCSGQDIIWVVGFRPSERSRITPETSQILHILVVKKDLG